MRQKDSLFGVPIKQIISRISVFSLPPHTEKPRILTLADPIEIKIKAMSAISAI